MNHEKNIPAKQQAAQEKTRFQGSHAFSDGAESFEFSAEEGAQTRQRLTNRRLTRKQRLQRRADFQLTYREGERVIGRYLVLFARPSVLGCCRLGITASRKVGSAVVRTRCRRRIRELFRLNSEALSGLGVDLVVNVRRGCESVPWPELQGDYLAGLKRLRRAARIE